jgi:hypothetical protein
MSDEGRLGSIPPNEPHWYNGWSLIDGQITVPDTPGLELEFDLVDLDDDVEEDEA